MKVLDPCCGGKMFWFDKNDSRVLFMDNRKEDHILCDGRKFSIKPDKLGCFTCLPFQNNKFNIVVFDPPHFKDLGYKSWMAKKYGVLPIGWEVLIKSGFRECFRVLKKDGVLIFKWNEAQISIKEVLSLTTESPLFGHTTMKNNKTIWICFMKGLQNDRK